MTGIGPEGVEQLLFGDERRRMIDEVEEQVEELGREIDRLIPAKDAIAAAIDEKRAYALRAHVLGTWRVSEL